jgi:hypothetical protein
MTADTGRFVCHPLRQKCACYLIFYGLEHIFVDLAQGADPVIRDVFKRGSRSDAAVRVAFFGIVHVLTHGADIFLHLFVFYLR